MRGSVVVKALCCKPEGCGFVSQWGGFFLMYLLTYVWIWALPEKLPIVQPFRKIPAIWRNMKVHHRVHKSPPLVPILSHSIQTIPSHPISLRSILILSTHLRLGLPSGLFPSGFPTNILYAILVYNLPNLIYCGPGVDSASSRNEYQESLKIKKPGGKVRPARRADNLADIY
jgi:hypothetical protein